MGTGMTSYESIESWKKRNGYDCKCDMRTKVLGDGCEHCNPKLALEYTKETISDLKERIEELEKALAYIAEQKGATAIGAFAESKLD